MWIDNLLSRLYAHRRQKKCFAHTISPVDFCTENQPLGLFDCTDVTLTQRFLRIPKPSCGAHSWIPSSQIRRPVTIGLSHRGDPWPSKNSLQRALPLRDYNRHGTMQGPKRQQRLSKKWISATIKKYQKRCTSDALGPIKQFFIVRVRWQNANAICGAPHRSHRTFGSSNGSFRDCRERKSLGETKTA